jgi:hypothetical protein
MEDKKAQWFMWSLGYTGSFAVSCEGLSGGLALFWLQPFSISLKGFNAHCINVVISANSRDSWRTTFVYGEPHREKRHEFWDLLRRLRAQRDGPWICVGDFNEVLAHDEHYGPNKRSDAQIQQFRQCLEDCGMSDLGFTGPKYTWSNKQDGESNVRV